ncbi:MAG TPA: hypothetical protein VF008_00470, partial [Niastella sp.]
MVPGKGSAVFFHVFSFILFQVLVAFNVLEESIALLLGSIGIAAYFETFYKCYFRRIFRYIYSIIPLTITINIVRIPVRLPFLRL